MTHYWVIEHEVVPGHYLAGPYIRRWRDRIDERTLKFATKESCLIAIDILAPGAEACEVVEPAVEDVVPPVPSLLLHQAQHRQGVAP